MMDYPTWRKKAPTPQFITFSNAYRLDQLVNDERTQIAAATTTTGTGTAATTGASATETATTTTLPTTAAPTPTPTAGNVPMVGVSSVVSQQQHQQQTPNADNIATIIGVTAGSHTNVLHSQTVSNYGFF